MDGLPVDIPGLPTFNGDDYDYLITGFDGWDDGVKPDAVFAPNGGGPGVVLFGAWLPAENYLTVAGSIMGDRAAQMEAKKALLAGLPTTRESVIVVHDVDQDRQAWVRRYDRATFAIGPTFMDFQIPLIQADPYKYGVVPVGGGMGAFAGLSYYRIYGSATTPTYGDTYIDSYEGTVVGAGTRTYSLTGSVYTRSYIPSTTAGPYPDTLNVDSAGSVESRRVTIQIVGPVTAGGWWIENLASGQKQWANLDLADGQVLLLDSSRRRATVDGADASHLMFGDWLSLLPGANSYRLTVAVRTAAYGTVQALEAWE